MRFIVPALVAIQLGWIHPACAQIVQPAEAPPIAAQLSLFANCSAAMAISTGPAHGSAAPSMRG
jgi:hypothetical protein